MNLDQRVVFFSAGYRLNVEEPMNCKPVPLLILGLIGCLCCFLVSAEADEVSNKRADAEIIRDQEDLKEILGEVQLRMSALSKNLRATQPEDAEQLDKAALKIQTSQLPDDLAKVLENLRSESFFAALSRQDSVIEKLEEVIALLERQKLREEQELDRKLDELRRIREVLTLVRRREEKLLEKTTDFLKKMSELGNLKELGEKVDTKKKITKRQRMID